MPEEVQPKKKRILFLHPNFPAQFKHLASAAAACGHDARFLCQTHYGRRLPGVQRLTLKGSCSHEQLNAQGGDLIQRSATLANQYQRGLSKLQKSGWQPDVVISHSGWGCGLHVREVWPSCRHIAYLEWWFDPQSDFLNYDPENQDLNLSRKQGKKLWLRNQSLALELVTSDAIVAPTQWQARQLPPLLRERCFVIHDGIDLDRFKPDPNQRRFEEQVVTYGTRGMEPMRAFPQFICGIIPLLSKNAQIQVQIAGEDGIYYGGRPPQSHSTWGKWAKHQLSEAGLSQRVEWLGHLEPEAYIKWLQRSHCHVHMTHPFVASWSLLEAIACQCPMVVSDVKPVRELCEATKSVVTYVDHRNTHSLAAAITKTLPKPEEALADSRQLSLKSYSKAWSLEQWSHVAGLQLTTNH